MLHVTAARYEGGYKVWVQFNTGESGIVDLQDDLWGPVFEPLKNPENFQRFHVSDELHTIIWDNGADFAPEHLYEKLPKDSRQPALAKSDH